jgi:hypothetical protein
LRRFAEGRIPRLADLDGQVRCGHLDAQRVACEDRPVSGFKFLLMLRGGVPPDPACFVTAVRNWTVGEAFMVAGGKRFRLASRPRVLASLAGEGAASVASHLAYVRACAREAAARPRAGTPGWTGF